MPSADTVATPLTRRSEVALYVGNALASSAIAFLCLQLWRMNWHVPLHFTGDAVFTESLIKSMIDNGWFWFNAHTGAPGMASMLDYPAVDSAHWIVLKLISLVTRDWAATINTYYLLGFPATSVIALWAFRRLRLSIAASFVMSLLYAFLPYHTLRGEGHLFLTAYYIVPLALVLCVELAGAVPPLTSVNAAGESRIDLKAKWSWLVLGLCLLIGSSGIYYAYFSCFFLAVAALIGWWRRAERVRLVVGVLLIGTICLAIAVNLAPYAWYRAQAGPNPAGVERGIAGAEIYSLRPALMMLPVQGHRVSALGYMHFGYVHLLRSISPALDNEGDFSTLGLVGSVGFAFLLFTLIVGIRKKQPEDTDSILVDVSSLLGAGILFASSGGLGTIIGVVLPQIRAYNRISVFLAFLALFGAGLLMSRIEARVDRRRRMWLTPLVAVAVIAVGVFDLTTPAMVPAYAKNEATFSTGRAFVRSVQRGLPAGSEILQLPYVGFPESPPVQRMVDYDHFIPYLVSTDLRWSYGAVKGRADAAWAQEVSSLAAPQLVRRARAAGFAGIWIDTYGYADEARSLAAELASATGSVPQFSANRRFVYLALK